MEVANPAARPPPDKVQESQANRGGSSGPWAFGGGGGGEEVVVLSAGDVLYIPRGHVHEAWTITPDTSEEVYGEGGESSLHVTFGLELGEDALLKGLVLGCWEEFLLGRGESDDEKVKEKVKADVAEAGRLLASKVEEVGLMPVEGVAFRRGWKGMSRGAFLEAFASLERWGIGGSHDPPPLLKDFALWISSARFGPEAFDKVCALLTLEEEASRRERLAEWEEDCGKRLLPRAKGRENGDEL